MVPSIQADGVLPGWTYEYFPQWAIDAAEYLIRIWNEGAYGFTYGQIITIVGILLFSLIIRDPPHHNP